MSKIELTQEELDQKLAEARAGLYTEDEFKKKLTAEVDRRVDSGIKTGIENQKKKWEEEYSKKAQMTAEEIARQEFEEKMKSITERQRELDRKANQLEALNKLTEAQIPKTHYEKMLGLLISEDVEVTNSNVASFIDVFNSTKSEVESKLRAELAGVPKPSEGKTQEISSKQEFDKLSYAQKIEFKKNNPELFTKFIR